MIRKWLCSRRGHPYTVRVQLSPGMSPISYHCRCGAHYEYWEWDYDEGKHVRTLTSENV